MAPALISVPRNIKEWKKAAKEFNVLGTIDQVGSQEKIKSASKFQFKHFLGLRVIWDFDPKQARSIIPDEVNRQFQNAKANLKAIPYWNAYVNQIGEYKTSSYSARIGRVVPEELGSFINVCQYQQYVLSKFHLPINCKSI